MESSKEESPRQQPQSTTCFVMMPISDPPEYPSGHFKRVYDHLIVPACREAGVTPLRANEVKNTNVIVLDILRRTVTARISIVDLSSRNPNVLYELGIRHAFDLPVVLIKDKRTERVFDIQGIRTLDYDEGLRIDNVTTDTSALASAIKETIAAHNDDGNSLIRHLSIPKAELKQTNVSGDTSLVLEALQDIAHRLTGLERDRPIGRKPNRDPKRLPNGEPIQRGEAVYDGEGLCLGTFVTRDEDNVRLQTPEEEILVVHLFDEAFLKLTTLPF